MKHENKVLACVDQSHFADYVADYAAWAARRMHAPLELLHVIDRHPEVAMAADHSGAIGFDAQEQLLSELSDEDASRSKAAREQADPSWNRLRERALAAGVEAPDVRQRYGHLEAALARGDDVGLFVLGRRGELGRATQSPPRPQRRKRGAQPAQADPDGNGGLHRTAARDDRLRRRHRDPPRRGNDCAQPALQGSARAPAHVGQAGTGRGQSARMGTQNAGGCRLRGASLAGTGRCRASSRGRCRNAASTC